ncbi:gastrula zinc finger protein XlCGF17.1-like [Atheta coriaria]|uniref:gastrula zinc finger protein XlCGF17.1-like n=1 Tax=Dalotia coriaria TaxID=877792 RepID=UPI0031F3FDB1
MEAVLEPEDPDTDQQVTVEVFPDTVAEIIYLSDYQIINDTGSPIVDSEDTCDTEYEIGSVDTTKFPGSDFVLDESGTIVLLPSEESDPLSDLSTNDNSNELHSCSECKFQTDSLEKLESHQLLHAEDHQCADCLKTFCSYALLTKHIRDEHTAFMCFVCKLEIIGSKAHRTHLRQHETQCEYLCSTCKKDFANDEELMQHMKTHGAILLYACNICDEAFSKMPELSAHLKQAHPK